MGSSKTSADGGAEASGAGSAKGGAKSSGRARASKRTSRTAYAGEAPGEDDPLLAFEPYQHKAPRSNSITPARQVRFVQALAASGIVTQAAREIGVSLEALYRLRHQPGAEGFAAAWEAAIDRGMARLEDCALERALQGEERVIYKRGEVVAQWRRYDTQLLIFLLRQRRPERFHDGRFVNRVELMALRDGYRQAWEAREGMRSPEEIYASINAKLEAGAARRVAEEAVAEWEAERGAAGGG
jgi:hypothetical protein